MEREPGDRVNEQRLAERRARSRLAAQPHRRLHVHERQRDELREAAASTLLLTRVYQVARPVSWPGDVTEHHGHVRAQSDTVRGVVDLEPLGGRDLVGTDDAAHLVVEDLGGGPGERAEARVA